MKTPFRFQMLLAVLSMVSVVCIASSAWAAGKVYKLKFAHDNNPDASYHVGALKFQELVKAKTNGQVVVEVYPSAQLGDETTLLESVRMGTIDFATCGCPNASPVFPALNLFSLSYLFRDQAHFDSCLDDNSGITDKVKKLVADQKTGASIGAFFTIGKRNVVNRVKPIVVPEDLKGMPIRVMNSPIETEIWRTIGAIPTSIATSETYSALQANVVSAAENAPIIVYSFKFYEAAPYYSLTEHQFFLSPVFVSDLVAKKLPAELYKDVMECLKEAAIYERQADLAINEDALKKMAAAGCNINDNVNKEAFIKILTPLHDKIAEQYGMSEVLKEIRAKAQ